MSCIEMSIIILHPTGRSNVEFFSLSDLLSGSGEHSFAVVYATGKAFKIRRALMVTTSPTCES